MAGPLLFDRADPTVPVFHVREARRQDVSAVSALWQEMMDFHRELDSRFRFQPAAVNEFEKHFLATLRSGESAIFVAECAGDVVGYILGEIHSRKPLYPSGKYGFISDLAVTEARRREGIGTALVVRLMEWFVKKRATAVELFLAETNPASAAFWTSLGFQGFLRLVRRELE